MKEEMISVIVPVYNVEEFLERCVRSILNQTYKMFEILLIDDGSTDSSGVLCEKFAQDYERIKVFHKSNGGLGSARNFGIKQAKGKFVCFVDSDDKVKENYLEKLYYALVENNADISICGYDYSSGNYISSYENLNELIECKELLRRFASGEATFNFAWNKLYKIDIIKDMEMLYSDRHCAEDMYFNTYYYKHVYKATIIQEALYVYYVNMGSLSNGRRQNFWEDMLLIYSAFIETCKEKNVELEYANNLLVILFRNSVSNYFNYKHVSMKECNSYITNCLEINNFIEYNFMEHNLRKIDKVILNSIRKRRFFNIYFYMKCIKIIKKYFFKLFCKIRGTIAQK